MLRFKKNTLFYITLLYFALIAIIFILIIRCENIDLLETNTDMNVEIIHTSFKGTNRTKGQIDLHMLCDLRIIVITYNRPNSLTRLLNSLNNAIYNKDSVLLDVWIDRSRDNSVNYEVVSTARAFIFQHGNYRVNIHGQHVGIHGQWINVSCS